MRVFLSLFISIAGCSGSDDEPDDTGSPDSEADVPSLVDAAAFVARLEALEALADANGGDRDSTSVGERAAMDWARAELEGLGWTVEEQTFTWGIPLRSSANLLAKSPFGTDEAVVLMGAHIDTVRGAAGINDNGTGVVGVIGLAEALTARAAPPERQVRVALFTREEVGLMGSHVFVYDMSDADAEAMVAYVNIDMVGSPNGVPFVLDSDGSTSEAEGLVPESQIVEDLLGEWFDSESLPSESALYESNSDFVTFADRSIPVGGVQSGSGGYKTEEEEALYGGAAGFPYDPCYHTECDDVDNVDADLALGLVRAAGHAVEVLADGGAL